MDFPISSHFDLVTTAATLHVAGIRRDIKRRTSAQALASLGRKVWPCIICTGNRRHGLLSVPVLAGSAAYALARLGAGRSDWPANLQAKAFCTGFAAATFPRAMANCWV